MRPSLYFDVLPYHPGPRPFEALTSYLTRLAQGNGLKSLQGVKSISFPKGQPGPDAIPSDFPPAAWGILPGVTACPEPVLLETTFYYMAQKFGRAASSQAMGRFLQGSLSPTLRYCPACLAEEAYYRLPWRFLSLTGCAKHGTFLLDRCEHCGQAIALLATPFKMGHCPGCGGDLRRCQAAFLSDQAWQTVREHDQDLHFLLAAHRPSTISLAETVKSVGLRFVYWRLKRGEFALNVAHQANLPHWTIYALEGRSHGSPPFERYVQYAAYLGITLRQLFATILPADINDQNWRAWCRTTLLREQILVERVQTAVETLAAANQPISQNTISQMVEMGPQTLQRYPRVKLILDQVTANRELGQQQRFQSREQDLLQQVELALDHLQAEGKPITQRTVSCQVGISRATLRNYPQVTTRLAAAATDFYLARRRQLQDTLQGLSPTSPREAELVTAVQAAVEQLQAQNRVVTQKAVSQMVGLVLSTLRCYPRVKLLLELIAVETDLACQRQILSIPSKRQPSVQPNSDREAQLVAAVRAAMKLLKGQKTPITERRIAHIVGIGPSSLKRYAGIRDIFRRVAAERAQLKQLHRQQREQRLVVQIQEAVSHLETHDQPLTQANIIQLVGVSRSTLINFSQVRTLLNQIKAKRISTVNFEAEQRDQALIEKTKQAAETLTRLGQRVTKHAIGQLVGLTPTGYKKYPQAHRFLDQVTRGG